MTIDHDYSFSELFSLIMFLVMNIINNQLKPDIKVDAGPFGPNAGTIRPFILVHVPFRYI